MSPVVDAHVHVWGAELLDIAWLGEPSAAALRREFTLDELSPALAASGIDRVVLVAADESLAGSRLLLERAHDDRRVGAVVGWVDLVSADALAALASQRGLPGGGLLRGVRQPTFDKDAAWWSALSRADTLDELERCGLVLELLVPASDLPRVAALAATRPRLSLVVDHLGHPATPDDLGWRRGLAALAPHSGVAVKISGVPFDDAGFERVVEFAREALGPDRLLAGSDWPIVLRRTNPTAEWSRLMRATKHWRTAHRAALLGGTAARVYGIAS